ncbi:unnamed protein product [Caretta caretta]
MTQGAGGGGGGGGEGGLFGERGISEQERGLTSGSAASQTHLHSPSGTLTAPAAASGRPGNRNWKLFFSFAVGSGKRWWTKGDGSVWWGSLGKSACVCLRPNAGLGLRLPSTHAWKEERETKSDR